ncbi:MAG TPA: protein DpdD [Acidimicrobiales bacterium]|nr:protein DpdD [Acidimicrobiales bacterium]
MTQDVDGFLDAFFGDGNELTPAALAEANPALAEWLEERVRSLKHDPLAPALLPRRQGNTTTWYGLTHSPRERRELIQALQSFVGPTYGTIRIDHPLDPSDSVATAAQTFADGHAFAVEVLPGQQAGVRQAVELLFELREQRPRRHVSVARPLGRLLREFEMAVLAGAAELSADLLGDIEVTGQLSAQNIIFLRIRRLGGLRNFREVMDLPELATILSIRRPARVTAALFDALYATELVGFEAAADAAGALDHFREVVLPRYPALFRSRQGLQTSSAIKSHALYTAVAHPEDERLLSQLASAPDLQPDERSYLEAVAHLVSPLVERGATLAAAVQAARDGNFDAALELARDGAPTIERAELLVRCAIEIDSLDAMALARGAVYDLVDTDRLRVTSSKLYATPWERIERVLGGDEVRQSPDNWLGWFERATSSEGFENALEVAERSVVEWTSEALVPADSRAISLLLNQDLSAASLRRVKDALPHLLHFIDRVSDPAQHRALLDDLSTLLLLDEDPSVADVAVLVNLLGSIFELGAESARRRELVDDFAALFTRVDAAAYLDSAIELFDIVLTFAASDAGPRDTSLAMLLAAAQRWRRRVRADQWMMLRDLAEEVGAADAVRGLVPQEPDDIEPEDSSQGDSLAGKTVAIYTLTEPAGVRARDFLVRNFTAVSVVLSSEHVGSNRLASLAHSADVFVVATRSAKHAATTFIEAQRPPNRPPVYASGKGSVSLIRAVMSTL